MSAFHRKFNTVTHVYIPLIKRGVVDFAVGADFTPVAGDVKISKDGGAAANVTNLPVAIAMGNGAVWDFSLTAAELSAAKVVVTVADAVTKAVEDTAFLVETYGNASAEYQQDLSAAKYAATLGSADYAGNTVQSGDSYARIGNTGSALTSLAPASTALSTAVWTNGRAAFLDNLDAAISTRSTYAGADTAGTTTLLSRLTATRAGLLDNLDAAVSTRSTYAGGDTAGTTTLLARLTSTRAGLLDNLDAAISTRSTYAGADTSGTTTLLTRIPGVVQPQTGDAYARLGAPVGASHSVDVAAVKADTAAVKVVTDHLATAIELDGAVYRFTVNALEQAPAGGGGGLDAYAKAQLYGNVVVDTAGGSTFFDVDDPTFARLHFARVDYPGGRTVTLDPT